MSRGLLITGLSVGAIALFALSENRPLVQAQSMARPAASQAAPAVILAQISDPMASPPAVTVDETALRYFARQGDTQRVETEIARLRLLYPDWEPPENLLGNDYTPDPMIERIWALYGQGDFAAARAAIAEKQAADPGWQPTEDMLHSLALGEAGERMRNASAASQHGTVISIAANMPELLVCANIDLLWALADAFIATENTQRGIDAYSYALTNCEEPGERFTTMQQAIERLARADLEPLLGLERPDAQGVGEFEPLRLDLARDAIVSVLDGDSSEAEPEDVRRLEAAIAAGGDVEDMRLLGWYALARNRPSEALDWFERAMADEPSGASVQGLGTVLLELERPAEAEAALADYAEESEELTALYLASAAALTAITPRVELAPAVLERITDIAYRHRDGVTAQELGWYALDFNQVAAALAWFETALGWDAGNEPAAFGVVVASDRLGDGVRVAEIQRLWAGRSERIAQFGTDEGTAQEAQEAAPVRAAATAPASAPVARAAQPTAITVSYQGCSSYVPAASLSPDQALTRGWCLMDMLRPAEAVENFSRALQSPGQATRSDAAYGQALAYIRMGLAEHAAVAAAAAPLPQSRVIELQAAILTLTATAAYDTGDYRKTIVTLDQRLRYAPEQNDLLTLRGWSYFHLRRYREAEQIFTAVAATGHREAAEGLAAVAGIPDR